MKHKNNFINKTLRYIWDYIESYLATWFQKIMFLLAIVVAELVSAYLIAVFDVGLKNLDLSIKGMLREYSVPSERYPWGVLGVFTLCILLVAALVIWKNGTPPGGRNFKLSKSDVYGSGREINQRELRQAVDVTHKNNTVGTILGQLDDTGKQVVASKLKGMPINDNMLIFGTPGCGKSTSYVKPYIAQAILRRHSVITSDTKGEVYSDTVELARRHGYRVLRLDLKDPAHSDGWNVLKELRHDDVRALTFAQTVMANTGNPHDNFAAPQESLLKACCLYQERHPDLADSQRTFYNAFSLLLQGAEALDATITAAFNTYGECMQVVADSYATFLQGSPNLRGNIITGLANRLQVLASPPVRHMTSTDEIDFASVGEIPTILYISMSDQHQAMKFLASLAFAFAFQDLVELADSKPSQKLDVPVCFLMEEFYSIGTINNIGNILSTGRSRGISIALIVQSLSQLKERYEDNLTETILADCATWICLGSNNQSTSELFEWRSGEATVQVKTVQHDAMEPSFRLAHRHSSGDGRRNFYTSNDVMKIKGREEALIIFQQLDPLKCRAFPIFQHKEFTSGHMPVVSSKSLIPLSNKKAKEYFREWEEERIASFNVWMENGGDPLKGYNVPKKNKNHGPAEDEDLPEIIPIHSLERMALAKAAGKKYNPKADPDNPLYDERYDPDSPKYDAALAAAFQRGEDLQAPQSVVAEKPLWDLTGVIFEKVEPEPEDPPLQVEESSPNGMPNLDTDAPVATEAPPETYPASMPSMEQEPPEESVTPEPPPQQADAYQAPEDIPEFTAEQIQNVEPIEEEPVVQPQPKREQKTDDKKADHQNGNCSYGSKSYGDTKDTVPMGNVFGGSSRKLPEKQKTALDGSHKKMPPKKTGSEEES